MPAYSCRVNLEFWGDAIPTIAALVAAIAGILASTLSRRHSAIERPKPKPLEDLLQQLTVNAKEAGRLATLVQVEIQAQLTAVAKLRKDATEAEQLAALHGAAADAVAAQIRAAATAENKKASRVAIWSGALYFVAGVAASIFVTMLVRPIGG